MYMDFTLREQVGTASSESRAEAIASLVTKFGARRVSAFAKGRKVYVQYTPERIYHVDLKHISSWLETDVSQFDRVGGSSIKYAKSLLDADRDDKRVQQILEEMILVESEKMNG